MNCLRENPKLYHSISRQPYILDVKSPQNVSYDTKCLYYCLAHESEYFNVLLLLLESQKAM